MSSLPTLSQERSLSIGGAVHLSKKRKAAIIVRVLLQEGAQIALTDLPEAMQEELTHEMGALRAIDRATLDEVINEFITELDAIGVTFPGGLAGALDALDGTISPETAARLRKKAGVPLHAEPWAIIASLQAEQVVELLEKESIEIAAVVLSKLPVSTAAQTLGLLPGERARRITYAVSQTNQIDPDTVQTIGSALAAQVSSRPAVAFNDGPVQRVGAILNSSPAQTRDDVLGGLEETDAHFAEEVRKAIFTFANIPQRIDKRDIPKITRAVDQMVLVTALAGATGNDAKAAEFVLESMSQRMAQGLRDEMQDLGKVKPKDAEEAMTAIVGAIREMETAGELLLLSDDEAEG